MYQNDSKILRQILFVAIFEGFMWDNKRRSFLLDISYAAEKIGLRTVAVKATMENLTNRIPLPCIIHWDQHHFIVVYKTKKGKIYVSDPPKACFPIRKRISKTDGIRKGKNSGC